MTENRRFAVRARILAGWFALAGSIGLAGCGGGNGAPNNVFNTPGDLTVQPPALTAYSMTPATLTIQGGQPPYQIFSSDQSTLAVQPDVNGSTVTLVPNNVSAITQVTLTVTDKFAASSKAAVSVNPAPLINSLQLKPDSYTDTCPNPGGSSTPTDQASSSFICSGQTASVAVRLANVAAGGLAGRMIRFDVVQGAFQLFTELPGQTPTFALTYTVPSDQNGNAVARVRANPGASTQTAIVQATDVSTGAYVRGTFVIVAVVNANASDLVVIPTTVNFTGPTTQSCSNGVSSTFYIFGGQPPYTVVQGFSNALTLSTNLVPVSGGGFTVTTLGNCPFTNDPLVITDAVGHTITATANSAFGTLPPPTVQTNNPILVAPTPITTLSCAAPSTTIAVSGGGTTSTSGTTKTVTPATSFLVSTNRPDILSITPTTVGPLLPVTLTRIAGTVGGSAPFSVSVSIFDGVQTTTVSVPLANNTCP